MKQRFMQGRFFMSKRTLKQTTGFVIVSMLFLFAFSATAPAAAKTATLSSLLKTSGTTFKIQLLNRTDGFLFGLTVKGKNSPPVTIAPGFDRKLLVQLNGSDMIFQTNAAGVTEVIQADGDLTTALCILKTITGFFTGLQTCQGDPLCLFTQIFSLVTNITTCTSGTTL
jgi:hypothetical protein